VVDVAAIEDGLPVLRFEVHRGVATLASRVQVDAAISLHSKLGGGAYSLGLLKKVSLMRLWTTTTDANTEISRSVPLVRTSYGSPTAGHL
jgi:hypothetical protein